MRCDEFGHDGDVTSAVDPRFRCRYCGEKGYGPRWWAGDNEKFENCGCHKPYFMHWMDCE